MLNKTLLIGNLTADPQKFNFQNSSLCKFSIGVQSTYKNEEPLFIEINCWNKTAENCEKYLKKGSKVLIEGRLKLEKWIDKNQNKKQKIAVVADSVKFMPSSNSSEESIKEVEQVKNHIQEKSSQTEEKTVNYTEEEDEELLRSIPF